MNSSLVLNVAFRGAAFVILLLIAWTLWRAYAPSLAARIGALFALGVAAFAVSSAPGIAGHPVWWHAPFVVLASGNAIVLWLFTCSLFSDDFKVQRWHAAVWIVLACIGIATCYGGIADYPEIYVPLAVSLTLSNFFFAVLALNQSLVTWRTDLVERRRQLRLVIVGAIGLYTLIMTSIVLLSGRDAEAVLASTTNAFGLAVISFGIALRLVRADVGDLFIAPPPTPTPVPPEIEAPDPGLVAALIQLMEADRIYRQHELTIGLLADRMAVPEHRLRKLINRGLGYRNFNAFLNRYRLEEIRVALADPAKANLPILTIALDAGFQSIGPFNRAFKAHFGLTPTEFRGQAGQPTQNFAPILKSASIVSVSARQ